MSQFPMHENQSKLPGPPHRGLNWGWIFAAFFGAMFMLLLGMFIMYIRMNESKPQALDFAKAREMIDEKPASPDSFDKSGNEDEQAPAEETPAEERSVVGSEEDFANEPVRKRLADLPDLAEMQINQQQNGESNLQYGWNEKEIAYDFKLEFRIDGQALNFSGRTTYQPVSTDPKSLIRSRESQEGTGTGFVVHPQGLIVTCAHVVKGAKTVQVTVEGITHPATVVTLDHEKDLAFLRIQEDNLAYLSISSPDQVTQGQSIRAFGFPLTELLGNSIKITSGSVSGFSNDGKQIQIDATINPGNSGGPVVDDQGDVVGVASAMLDAEGISRVGLAVGTGELETLLKANQLPWSKAGERQLSQTEVNRAVVFIRSKGDAFDKQSGQVVKYDSRFSASPGRSSPENALLSRMLTERVRDDGSVVFDSRGILGNEKATQKTLPLIFHKVCQIGVEQLPWSTSLKSWTDQQLVFIESTTQEPVRTADPFDIRSRFRRDYSPLSPFGGRRDTVRESTVTTVANQTEQFRLISNSEKEAVFSRIFEIETIESPDKKHDLGIRFEGQYTFDKQQRKLTGGKFSGRTTTRIGGRRKTIPFDFSYDVVTAEQLQEEKERVAAIQKAMREKKQRIEAITSRGLDQWDPDK